jgi:hypothetical protein
MTEYCFDMPRLLGFQGNFDFPSSLLIRRAQSKRRAIAMTGKFPQQTKGVFPT